MFSLVSLYEPSIFLLFFFWLLSFARVATANHLTQKIWDCFTPNSFPHTTWAWTRTLGITRPWHWPWPTAVLLYKHIVFKSALCVLSIVPVFIKWISFYCFHHLCSFNHFFPSFYEKKTTPNKTLCGTAVTFWIQFISKFVEIIVIYKKTFLLMGG